MIGYSDLKFNKDDPKMYHKDVDTKVELVPHLKHKNMFHIYFGAPDSIAGMTSEFFNETRAKDNARKMYLNAVNKLTEDTTLEGARLPQGSPLVRYLVQPLVIVPTCAK